MDDDRFVINSSAAWMVFLYIFAAHLNPIPSQYRIHPACQYSMMIVASLPQQVLTHFTDRNTFNDERSQVKLRKRCDGIVVVRH